VTAAYRADLLLDHYSPRDRGASATVAVLVHGCCGDRRDLAGLARALAGQGAMVVNADVHALADGGGWPATYVDVVCAYAWARAHGADAGAATKVAIVGWGDGALVSITAALGWDMIAPLARDCEARVPAAGPDRVIALSGHFGWTGEPTDVVVNTSTIDWFGGRPEKATAAWRYGNPGWWLDHATSEDVSFVLVDTADDHATPAFAAELQARSFATELVVLGPGQHAEVIQPRGTLGRAALGALARTLELDDVTQEEPR
jgi:hypothetical protein